MGYFALSILVITGFVMVITTAFNFLNIEFQVYGSYLIWFIALFLFYWILPSTSGDIFMGAVDLNVQ
jgi:hypothetical protein|tara:strand:- start:695 stop:895 length:201 start_codon:yes stop_codon:yes gene_type:complete